LYVEGEFTDPAEDAGAVWEMWSIEYTLTQKMVDSKFELPRKNQI